MFDRELDIIAAIDNNRIKLVLLDNLLELAMQEYFLDNSYYLGENYIRFNENPKKRLDILRNFDDKVNYCVKETIFTEELGNVIKVFHRMRNESYHRGMRFSLIFPDVLILYQNILVKTLDMMDVSVVSKHKLSTEEDYGLKLVNKIKEDLKTRFNKIKNDVKFIATGISDNFNEDEDDIEDFEWELQHVFYNYGYFTIEKSSVSRGEKLEYLRVCTDEPDFVETKSPLEKSSILKLRDVNKWENELKKIKNGDHYKALELWYKIDRKLSLMEEIIKEYIWIAC